MMNGRWVLVGGLMLRAGADGTKTQLAVEPVLTPSLEYQPL